MMPKTYDTANLKAYSPTSLVKARTWARHLAGDYPINPDAYPPAYPVDSWDDNVWDAWLALTAYVVEGITYYRPHEAAASALEANPHWLQRESLLGSSQEKRPLEAILTSIRKAGAPLDQAIANAEEALGRTYTLRTGSWEVVF